MEWHVTQKSTAISTKVFLFFPLLNERDEMKGRKKASFWLNVDMIQKHLYKHISCCCYTSAIVIIKVCLIWTLLLMSQILTYTHIKWHSSLGDVGITYLLFIKDFRSILSMHAFLPHSPCSSTNRYLHVFMFMLGVSFINFTKLFFLFFPFLNTIRIYFKNDKENYVT